MDDIILRYVPMPVSIPAVTSTDENGDYNVYINCNLGYLAQERAKCHELEHINKNHFYRNSSVAQDEAEAEAPVLNVTVVKEPTLMDLRIKAGFNVARAASFVNMTYEQYILAEYGKLPNKEIIDQAKSYLETYIKAYIDKDY